MSPRRSPLPLFLFCLFEMALAEPDDESVSLGSDHADAVAQALAELELSETVSKAADSIVSLSKTAWIEWFARYEGVLREYDRKIAALKKGGSRSELKRAEAARDRILEKMPSLLNDDQELKKILSDEQYEELTEALAPRREKSEA